MNSEEVAKEIETIINSEKQYEGLQLRILKLLGSGLSSEIVSTAAGVSASYISQLLAEESFAMQVTQLRFDALQVNNKRDNEYDSLEDTLMEKMKDLVPLMYRPMEILRAIQVINAARRRGSSAPEQVTINNTVINLNLPKHQYAKIMKSIDGQVVQIGNESLTTIPSSMLLNQVAANKPAALTHSNTTQEELTDEYKLGISTNKVETTKVRREAA